MTYHLFCLVMMITDYNYNVDPVHKQCHNLILRVYMQSTPHRLYQEFIICKRRRVSYSGRASTNIKREVFTFLYDFDCILHQHLPSWTRASLSDIIKVQQGIVARVAMESTPQRPVLFSQIKTSSEANLRTVHDVMGPLLKCM